jgi:predicted RNA-binding Zn-ribbon protein involved in translation (DUF1610 family)
VTPATLSACPDCGWQDPVPVAKTVRVTTAANGQVSDRNSGLILRCPMCQTLYAVTPAGTKRCTRVQPEPQAKSPASERERPEPARYPSLPADVLEPWSRRGA